GVGCRIALGVALGEQALVGIIGVGAFSIVWVGDADQVTGRVVTEGRSAAGRVGHAGEATVGSVGQRRDKADRVGDTSQATGGVVRISGGIAIAVAVAGHAPARVKENLPAVGIAAHKASIGIARHQRKVTRRRDKRRVTSAETEDLRKVPAFTDRRIGVWR